MGTHYKGTKREVQALDTFIKLMRGTGSLSSRLRSQLDNSSLTESQFSVLEALLHLGPLCPSSLAQKLLQTAGNLTLVIRNLEKQGLVRRKQEGSDRRYFTISLTPAGEKLIRKVFAKHVLAITLEMQALSPEEQAELGRLCKKLGLSRATLEG
ncbi:MAG: Transcriptional regulator [Acidobacteriales bacterium]|nr:Transcriptional regulator [Terriglobales bacterium]